VLAKPPKALLADRGYDSDGVREDLLMRNILSIIPTKANWRDTVSCGHRRYRDRNYVGRLFNRLKQCRRVGTRYDNPATSFLGTSWQPPFAYGYPTMST
jgi:transposase